MDRAVIEERLAMAERHITVGESHIARQRELVAELDQNGRDAAEAVKLLGLFEATQALHVADRDRLRAQLATMRW